MLDAICTFSVVEGAGPNISITSVPRRGFFLFAWKIVCFEAAVNSEGECFRQTLKF